MTEELRTLVHSFDVEVVDTAHIVGCEGYLLVLAVRQLDKVVGRGDDGTVTGCPCEGRLELRAECLDAWDSEPCTLQIVSEVNPEDVGDLYGHQCAGVLLLDDAEMPFQTGQAFAELRRKLLLEVDLLVDDFD